MPGGNPDLKPEQGVTFDGGITTTHKETRYSWNGSVTGFYSLIDNWGGDRMVAHLPKDSGHRSMSNR